MYLQISYWTHNGGGSHQILSLIPAFLELEDIEFGADITSIFVTAYFLPGINPSGEQEEIFLDLYKNSISDLPKYTYYREQKQLKIKYLSKHLADDVERKLFQPPPNLDPHGTRGCKRLVKYLQELKAVLVDIGPELNQQCDFAWKKLAEHIEDKLCNPPERDSALIELANHKSGTNGPMPEDAEFKFYENNSHPLAKEKLQDPFYWEIADDLAPIGNDTAADALSNFWPWRDTAGFLPTLWFVKEEFVHWGYSREQLNQVLVGAWEDRTESSKYHLAANVFDALVVAIAYGQFMKEGCVDLELREEALKALDRQLHPKVINYTCAYPRKGEKAFQKSKEGLMMMPIKKYSVGDSIKKHVFSSATGIIKRFLR